VRTFPDVDEFLHSLQDRATVESYLTHFQRLVNDIKRAAADLTPAEEQDELLSLYLHAELSGGDARALYPEVDALIVSSPVYRAEYEFLRTILVEEEQAVDRELALPAPQLPFLSASPKDTIESSSGTPWKVHLHSRLTGNPFRLRFSFAPSFLLGLQGPALAPVTLRADTMDAAQISAAQPLLMQTVQVGAEELMAEIYAVRVAQDPQHLHLRAVLGGGQASPAGVIVQLTWGNVSRSAVIDAEGNADLGLVGLASVENAIRDHSGMFEIAFEIPH